MIENTTAPPEPAAPPVYLEVGAGGLRRRIAVTLNGKPVDQLNELEAVDGAILANIWRAPFIVR
ncbi:MAG: glutaminyl-peptide cyclotransferase, partial [Rhizobiales bacterium]|nr:glutaminyl-peptide cyclotransferase [Hyphomicrobiales bacterium]